jgi:phosphonate transport system permease protein
VPLVPPGHRRDHLREGRRLRRAGGHRGADDRVDRFLGKLFTEAIEEISLKQIEAIRSTGASFMNTIVFGVVPQVMFRFIGFSAYETDANLRNSTMVGIVGAGGIGGTLFAAFQRFDYDFVLAILLAIIALIMIGEVLQIQVKRVFRQ